MISNTDYHDILIKHLYPFIRTLMFVWYHRIVFYNISTQYSTNELINSYHFPENRNFNFYIIGRCSLPAPLKWILLLLRSVPDLRFVIFLKNPNP